ncbi:hypothetical protein FE392_05855 [Xenorhabdus sp. 12]|uniref:Uncharacterized protein n=1 Tax=Xenorhabdus santafensis TaxID=2582833 RepID=A0ABU4S7T5_9GAMM|nr:hypothetical protein [Xenorhabdus sp. 12]MDX7986857.1 hypothetical protein [Xenorhabdus sp. 12]
MMKNEIFSKGWFKDLFLFFIKELLWTKIPVFAIFIWSMIALYFFPDYWLGLSSVGSIIILALTFFFMYISEKKKAKHKD